MKLNFAPNQRQLAKALGVSRQLISYHSKQSGSPQATDDGRHDVEAWREYLSGVGRVETKGPQDESAIIAVRNMGCNLLRRVSEQSATWALESAGTVLPEVVKECTEGKLTDVEASQLAGKVWSALVCRLTGAVKADRFNKVFAADNQGHTLDDTWHSIGFLDVSDVPKSFPVRTPSQILEAAQVAGMNMPYGIDIISDSEITEPNPS